MLALIMIAQREMDRGQRAHRINQFAEGCVIAGQPFFKREIAIHNDGGRRNGPRGKIAHHRRQMIGHVHMTRNFRRIGRNVRIREKGEHVLIARFGKGARRQHGGNTGEGGALQKVAAC